VQDLAAVREAFADPKEFWSSPLYRRLSTVVAADPFLVGIAAHARAGQGPTFAFFGAVHAVLLDGTQEELAEYYQSIRGTSARPPDDEAGRALTAFAHKHADRLRSMLGTRLVQTNHVQRAFGLRLGLATVAPDLDARPVHLLEVGSSAGLVLRQAFYGYQLGDRCFGDRASEIQLAAEWRSHVPIPDLDAIPALASTTGIDLNPLNPDDEGDRRWLEALVWPENGEQTRLMRAALNHASDHPVTILAGDAVDRCPEWSRTVPAGDVRIVFHCATRMHVPHERRALFDRSIDDIGRDGPLYRIAVEGDGLIITDPNGHTEKAFDVDGHLAWVKPLRP
jgi:hypothetical protein